MIPSTYITVDRIPTTVNGKQDNDALVTLLREELTFPAKSEGAKCSTSIKKDLHSIWADVLGLYDIDPDAEFFDLGGTSFSLIIMLQRVNLKFKTDLRIEVFSKGATLSTLIKTLTDQ
ncbi:Gramicidin S synthase 2 [compost metagenome]